MQKVQDYSLAEAFTKVCIKRRFDYYCNISVNQINSVKLVEGKAALGVSHAFFNKKASAAYKKLSTSDREQLEQEVPFEYMSKQQIERRVQRIFKSIQNQVS